MSDKRRFDSVARARFLALREAGMSLAQACAATPTTRQTVGSWAARGRGPNATVDEREFARALDALPAAVGNGHRREADATPLGSDGLLGVLNEAARRGNATAAARLLRRAEREEASAGEPSYAPDHPFNWTTDDDPFLALEPESMAQLTPEQREHAIEVSGAAHARGVASIERSRRARVE